MPPAIVPPEKAYDGVVMKSCSTVPPGLLEGAARQDGENAVIVEQAAADVDQGGNVGDALRAVIYRRWAPGALI